MLLVGWLVDGRTNSCNELLLVDGGGAIQTMMMMISPVVYFNYRMLIIIVKAIVVTLQLTSFITIHEPIEPSHWMDG